LSWRRPGRLRRRSRNGARGLAPESPPPCVRLVRPALPDRGGPRGCLLLMRCSSGCRETSRRERWHFSTASNNSTPWCARDTSPGIGTSPHHQPYIGDRVVRGATWARRDERGTLTGEAGDTMAARGLNGLGEGHCRQDGGQPPRQPRLPRPRIQPQDVVGRTPVSTPRSPRPPA
jgi:hypothetical protein